MEPTSRPYVSVIIPAYNAQAFISFAIESVMIQPFKEIEVLVLDDQSSDDTLSVCRTLKKTYPRLRIFELRKCGAGAARNIGIRNAEGVWVMFLDSDDLYLKDAINESFSNKLMEYEKNGVDVIYTPTAFSDYAIVEQLKKIPLETDPGIIPSTSFVGCIYRREFLINKHLAFYEYQKQDIETAFRFLVKLSADKIVADDSMLFYLRRDNPKSNTHTWDIQDVSEVKSLVYYDLYKKNTNDEKIRDLLYKVCLQQMNYYFRNCKCTRFVKDRAAFSKMRSIYMISLMKNGFLTRRIFGYRWILRSLRDYVQAVLFSRNSSPKTGTTKVEEKPLPEINSTCLFRRYMLASSFLLERSGETFK